MKGTFRELRRRRVFRTTALYVVAAWVVLQVADVTFPGLGVPEEAIRYVWIGAFAALPLVILFAWRYQVTGDGIGRTAPRDRGESATVPLGTADYVILGAMALRGRDARRAHHESLQDRRAHREVAELGGGLRECGPAGEMGRGDDARRVLEELAESPGQKDLLMLGIVHGILGADDTPLDWLDLPEAE